MSINLAVISCTRHTEEESKNSSLYRCMDDFKYRGDIIFDFVYENTKGLPEVYNEKIEQYKNLDINYLVFCHDDVYIDDLKLVEKIMYAKKQLGYDIVGLAGCLNPRLNNPALWHIMSEKKDYRGQVAHPASKDSSQTYMTAFGPTPSRVALIDGLFMAIHLPSILDKGWRFNENYTFHHYDLASCIDANRKGLKIGVYPIHVIHQSPGLLSMEDKLWKDSNQKFLQEYAQ